MGILDEDPNLAPPYGPRRSAARLQAGFDGSMGGFTAVPPADGVRPGLEVVIEFSFQFYGMTLET